LENAMELPLDLVPLIVAAADCETASTLARVCMAAAGAVAAKFGALITDAAVVRCDGILMWMQDQLYVFDTVAGNISVYYFTPGPDIEFIPELSSGPRMTPPKQLVKKYFDLLSGRDKLTSFA